MTPEIKAYLTSLVDESGQSLPDEVKAILINDLYARLEQRLMLAAMSQLSEQDQTTLEKMAEEKKDTMEIQQFLLAKIPNYQDFFGQQLVEFRNLYLAK